MTKPCYIWELHIFLYLKRQNSDNKEKWKTTSLNLKHSETKPIYQVCRITRPSRDLLTEITLKHNILTVSPQWHIF